MRKQMMDTEYRGSWLVKFIAFAATSRWSFAKDTMTTVRASADQ
jgi:hypothetical protein